MADQMDEKKARELVEFMNELGGCACGEQGHHKQHEAVGFLSGLEAGREGMRKEAQSWVPIQAAGCPLCEYEDGVLVNVCGYCGHASALAGETTKLRAQMDALVETLKKIGIDRVAALIRDAHEGDKVCCNAQSIRGDVIRILADVAPDRLPIDSINRGKAS